MQSHSIPILLLHKVKYSGSSKLHDQDTESDKRLIRRVLLPSPCMLIPKHQTVFCETVPLRWRDVNQAPECGRHARYTK